MKSFKKIALAMVAAMTAGTLVATPASAAPMTVVATTWNAAKVGGADFDTPATAGTSTATAITRSVPSDNSVDNVDVVKFVATVDTGTSVSVSATNAFIVDAVATLAAPKTASSGASTWSINVGTGTTATFFVYTKTTAIGTVSITNGGTTTTYYVQGTVGKVNSIALSGVDAAPAGTAVTVTATVLDVFGNKRSATDLTAIANGATLVATTATTGSGLTDFGTAEFKFTAPATGPVTVVVYLTNAVDLATAVTGFSNPTSSTVKVISVRDLAAELAAEKASHDATKAAAATAATKAAADLAAVQAELAKVKADSAKALADISDAHKAEISLLQAQNAATIKSIKDAFNALARKWNAKNPKAKVATLK